MLVWVLLKDRKRKTNNQVEISEKEDTPSECDSIGNPSDQDTGRGQGLNGGKKKKKQNLTRGQCRCSVQFGRSAVSNSLQPHGPQHRVLATGSSGKFLEFYFKQVYQFSSVTQSSLTLSDPMDQSL